jgi:RecA/RadA recombinase
MVQKSGDNGVPSQRGIAPRSGTEAASPSPSGEVLAMERFAECFERSARRWEIVVYPAMFAFVLLAGYGFYLIYSLTTDIHVMAQRFDPEMALNMREMAQNIGELAVSIDNMSKDMRTMTVAMEEMNVKMSDLAPMREHMAAMDASMRAMTVAMDQMRVVAGSVGYQIGRPMSMFNSFLP